MSHLSHFIPIMGLALAFFANVPYIYVGLKHNIKTCIYAVFFGAVLMGAQFSFLFSFPIAISQGLPLVAITYWISKHKTISQIISHLTLLNLFFFLGLSVVLWAAYSTDLDLWTKAWLGNLSQTPQGPPLEISWPRWIWGIGFVLMSLTLLLNALLSVKIFERLSGRKIRHFPLPNEFAPPKHWDIIFLTGLLLTFLPWPHLSFIGANIAAITTLPLAFTGLQIFYLWFSKFEVEKPWYFVLLFIMIILIWPLVFLLVIGLCEPILKLYPRFKNGKD